MTVITKLKLKNFKSFRRAEIPFAPGFTAIAGANASGKSNILDALLFSMGITSLKQLRASRLSELVNHDAKEGYAKVELYITDNNGRELEVTRIIDAQGKSIYKLDGKRKTLNEIQSLLLEIGVNPNGHNIVVQGDITRIIEMNAKQRRQIIEEVAGLSEFEEKKEEAIKKLEKVEQKVKDATIVLNEREAYLRQLEQERSNALKYNELVDESKRSKATILREEIKIIRKELEQAKKQMDSMQKEIDEKRKERDKLQEEERELEQKVEDATKKLIDASEQTYSGLGKEVEQKKADLGVLRERLSSRKESLAQKEKRKAELKEKQSGLSKEISEKTEELEAAKQELEGVKSLLLEVKKKIDTKSPRLAQKKEGAQKHEHIYITLGREVEKLKEQIHEVRMKKNGLEREAKSAQDSLAELEARKKRIEEKIAKKNEIEEKIAPLAKNDPAQRLISKEQDLEKAGHELHAVRARIESMEESLQTLARARSDCPTCESPLDEKKKEGILQKKKSELAKLRAKAHELGEKKENLSQEKHSLAAQERHLAELVHSLRAFEGLDEEMGAALEKISEKKERGDPKKIAELAREEKILLEKIDEAEKERLLAEKKLEEFRESEVNTEMNVLLEKLEELNAQKSEKEMLTTELRSEVERVLSHRSGEAQAESAQLEKDASELLLAMANLEKELGEKQKELAKAEAELDKQNRANRLLEEEKNRLVTKIKNISEKRDSLGRKIESLEKELNDTNLQQSRNDVRIVDLEEEHKEYASIKPLAEFVLNDLKKRIPEIEREIEKLGAINMKSLENFDSYKREVDDVRMKAQKLEEERRVVLEMIDKIEVKKFRVFMDCFEHVSGKFSQLYYNFFEGEGSLSLSDKENPLEGGLLIQAKYKEDTMKSI
ncbi:MAG: AAA family ATPase, partial [archaeon]|nr:AAA family ATPase [archaeon]